MPKSSAQNRARKIKLLLFDVDGVLTDGKLFFIPRAAPAENGSQSNISQANGAPLDLPASSPQMLEFKGFHAHDGVAISLARLGGIRTGLITKRVSETVALRARDLKLEYICQGIQDKGTAFRKTVQEAGLNPAKPPSWATTSSTCRPCAPPDLASL